MVAESDPP